jgi:uncharacterized SAM-binding protein YcdF (DUF218 family)
MPQSAKDRPSGESADTHHLQATPVSSEEPGNGSDAGRAARDRGAEAMTRAAGRADAIVVLGCASGSRLARRVARGASLYRAQVAPLLLLSGGGRGPEPEASIMRRMALAAAVPEAALIVEPGSRNTWENACESARLLRSRGLSRVVLVSDRAHLPRAGLLFRRAGLEVAGRAGIRPALTLFELRTWLRELAALPMTLFFAGRHPPQ